MRWRLPGQVGKGVRLVAVTGAGTGVWARARGASAKPVAAAQAVAAATPALDRAAA